MVYSPTDVADVTDVLGSVGTRARKDETASALLRRVGADFDVEKKPLSEVLGRKYGALDNQYVVVRKDTNEVIGQVGDNYTPMSNRDFFTLGDDLRLASKARILDFTMLDGGSRSVMRFAWPDNIVIGDRRLGDIVAREGILSTSHDGRYAGKLHIMVKRLVCLNGMTVIDGDRSVCFPMRHSYCGEAQFEQIRKMVPKIDAHFDRFQARANILAGEKVGLERAEKIIAKIMDPRTLAGENKDKSDNQAANRINTVTTLFDGGQPGSSLESVKGTAWGLYQAFTHYYNHERGTRGENQRELRYKAMLPESPVAKEMTKVFSGIVSELDLTDRMEAIAQSN